MIIEKKYDEGDVITFKTVAGEEVIARLAKQEKDSMKIRKPMALTSANGGLGMVPWTFTVNPDSSLDINLNTIVFLAKTDEGTAKQYIESTSGIKLTN